MSEKKFKLFLPVSQKKLKYLLPLLKNQQFSRSLVLLMKNNKLPSKILLKKLQQNKKVFMDFFIYQIIINKSKTLKRYQFRAKGRTTLILKKQSVIFLILKKNE